MQYFVATTDALKAANFVRISIKDAEHNRQNHISELVHEDNRSLLELLLRHKKGREKLSDILACLVAAYFGGGQLKDDYFVKNSMTTIRDNVQNCGFDTVDEVFVAAQMKKYSHIRSMVFGYQDEKALRRRVEAFVDFAIRLNKHQKVIFTGKNSASRSVSIRDEATQMRIMFDAICKERNSNIHEKIDIVYETASRDTIQNLDYCLKADFLEKYDGINKKQVLLLFSSTFHLIRIAENVVDIIRSPENEISKYVDKIVLIGAEDDTFKIYFADREYVKNMAYDILRKNLS